MTRREVFGFVQIIVGLACLYAGGVNPMEMLGVVLVVIGYGNRPVEGTVTFREPPPARGLFDYYGPG